MSSSTCHACCQGKGHMTLTNGVRPGEAVLTFQHIQVHIVNLLQYPGPTYVTYLCKAHIICHQQQNFKVTFFCLSLTNQEAP